MATFSPETKWDNIIYELDGFNCSTMYQNAPQGAGRLKIRDVIEIDCSDFDETVAVSEATAYIKDVYEFSNGVKIIAKFWASSQVAVDPLWGKLVTSYEGTDVPSIIYTTSLFRGAGGGVIFACNPSTLRKWGCRFLIYNDYFDANNPPAIGLSPMFQLVLSLYVPSEYIPDQPTYHKNDLSSINSNTVISIGQDSQTSMPYLYDEILPFSLITSILNLDNFITALENVGGEISDPYHTGGMDEPVQEFDPSGQGGGEGNYDDKSDPIDFPELPVGGAITSGAIKAFIVNPSILRTMFSVLWDISLFNILTQFQKLVEDPMDAIISLHCLPVTPHSSGVLGDIILGSFDTTANGWVIDNQYLTIDCGSLGIKEFWGSALDYNPYTKAEIYLPFIGIKELNVDDIMKSTVHIKYNIDVLTGDCIANIKCGLSVLYKFNGNLKQDIPLSGRSSDAILRTAQAGLSIASGLVTGTAVGGAVGAAMATSSSLSAAANVLSTKVVTTRSGSLGGSVGLLDDFRPYFILHRPVQSLAKDFKKFKGYPSNITATLSSLRGYTEVEFINLQNIPNATSAEMDEIKTLLGRGVLL